jgi:hypothetical protein
MVNCDVESCHREIGEWRQLALDPFPDDVRQFLESRVDSVEQLEILRILGEDPAREWRDDEIGAQIQSTLEMTLADLTTLEVRGLLRCARREGRVFCSFGPHSTELGLQMRRLLELYQQRPVTMIRLVYVRKANALRDFSEAFKFKKEN